MNFAWHALSSSQDVELPGLYKLVWSVLRSPACRGLVRSGSGATPVRQVQLR